MKEEEVFKSNEELAEEARAIKVGCFTVAIGAAILTALAYWWLFG